MVQGLPGHRNITTTLRCAHLNLVHKKKAVDDLYKMEERAMISRSHAPKNSDGHTFHQT